MMTTFVFRVHNIPAALYKAMGGFATNGVNMTKLESYQLGGTFFATQFYADIEGHPDDADVARALKELQLLFARGAHPRRLCRPSLSGEPGRAGRGAPGAAHAPAAMTCARPSGPAIRANGSAAPALLRGCRT